MPSIMKIDEMKNLLSEDLDVILKILNNSKRGFEGFLRQRDYDGKTIEVSMQLIVKACTSQNEGRVHMLLNMLYKYKDTFLSNDIFETITQIIEKDYQINPKHFLDSYVTILHHLLKKLEKLEFISQVIERLENFINELYCIHKNIKTIKDRLELIQNEIKRQVQHYEQPPEDFRSISIFPQAADMLNDNPFLEPNIIDGAYKNVDHYLSTQFRLMREDMIRSFRASISQIKGSNNNKVKFRSSGQRPEVEALFQKLKLSERPKYHLDGVHYTISFEFGNNVSKNNPFLPGSIVCLSCDNFVENFIFATIKSQEMRNKTCIISVIVEIDNCEILQGKKYELLVTNAYFESYRNILIALQDLNEVNFPLSDYIVKLDSSDSEPAYAGSIFCLHELCNFENDLQDSEGDDPCKMFDVLVKEEWPTEEELKLDTHQVLAFQAALTQKLAIIQGPPGTGKTFLGVKIVKALLENVDSKPIIICCQTNHALDQFLNHILKHTPKVLRAGSQSQDEGMSVRSLRNIGIAIQSYRECKMLNIDIPDEFQGSLKVVKCLIPDIDEWNAPKRHSDYLEFELRKLCPVLNDMMIEYLNLRFKYMEPTALTNFLPESMVKAYEMDQSQKVETIKHFIVTWLRIDSDNVYKRCEQEWESFDMADFSVAKENKQFNKHGSKNIWTISLNERYKYLYSWRKYKLKNLEASISQKRQEYFKLLNKCRRSPERRMQNVNLDQLELAKEADILGLTMTGAAKYKDLLSLLNPTIMIVEEAAETLESNIISSLVPSINQLILIGDHKQLRPLPADDDLSKNYNLSISLFERLVKNNIPHATLVTQHRMRPCISDLLVPHIYTELKCSKSVEAYESIKGMQHDLFFFNHNKPEDEKKGTSISNTYEATFISKLASYFLSIGYESSQITVLAMYSAQIALIQRLLREDDSDILVTTVDNYQGEENDIILISLVRSNESGIIGFLSESNRLCVALSRARKGLYCIGNFTMLARKSNFWLNVVQKLERGGQIGKEFPVQCPCHRNKIPVKSSEGFNNILEIGCGEMCGYQLPCKHYCQSPCHFYDTSHASVKCLQPCNKIIQVQRHNKTKERHCKRRCYQPCEDSKSFVKLPCGHQRLTELDNTINLPLEKCMMQMKKMLICGHDDQVPCSVLVEDHKCRAVVHVTLKCGHKKKLPCHQKEITEKVICSEPKPHSSICGHTVFIPCYMSPTEEVLLTYCKKSCDMLLMCGHPCLNPCNWCCNIKIHSNCSVPCERKLHCGHKCQGYCGSPCLECDLKCELACDHGTCINPCKKPCVECKKPCTRECVHQKCSKLCYEECSVPPCQKPCELKLPCNHKCIGLCGDPCPKLCRVCNKKDLKSADLNKDCFVYLSNSCKHVLEAKKLTSWIKGCATLLPNCFQCGATITQSCRFKDYIIKAKKKFLAAADSKFEMLDMITYQFHTFCGMDNVPTYHFLSLQKKLDDILMGKPSLSLLTRLPMIMFCLTDLYNWRIKTEANEEIENRFEILVKWLYNNMETASYQQLQELKESIMFLKNL